MPMKLTPVAALLCLSRGGGRGGRQFLADGFVVKEPPMPFKWPIVGTLPDFFARGGADRLQEIYEVSAGGVGG